MTDSRMASRLELRWFPVVDARGRTRLQAHWSDGAQVAEVTEERVTHAA